MGHDSYSRAIPKWIEQNRLSPPRSSSGSSEVPIRIAKRAQLWKLGHEKKQDDGTWGIDPKYPETLEVAKRL